MASCASVLGQGVLAAPHIVLATTMEAKQFPQTRRFEVLWMSYESQRSIGAFVQYCELSWLDHVAQVAT